MMKQWVKCSIMICLVSVAVIVLGCPGIVSHLGWTYSLGEYETGHTITQTSDGRYFIVGEGRPVGDTNGWPRMLAARLSSVGEIESWRIFDKFYPVSSPGPSAAGLNASDGGALLAGLTAPSLEAQADKRLRILKIDSLGQTEWDRTFGGTDEWQPNTLLATSDSRYVVAAYTYEVALSRSVVLLLKVEGTGDLFWVQKLVPEEGAMRANDANELEDGSLVIAGLWNRDVGATAGLIKTDAQGNPLWWRYYGEDEGATAEALSVAADGGFILAGTTHKITPERPVVARTDMNGNLLWIRE